MRGHEHERPAGDRCCRERSGRQSESRRLVPAQKAQLRPSWLMSGQSNEGSAHADAEDRRLHAEEGQGHADRQEGVDGGEAGGRSGR